MRRIPAVLLATLALCEPAAAQIDLSVCRYLPRHRPAPDVEHRPGVGVGGRPVAPADLPGSAGAMVPPDRFDIPVTFALARRLGFAAPGTGRGLPGDSEIGRLVLQGGRLYFNGQPIGGPGEAELYALCRSGR